MPLTAQQLMKKSGECQSMRPWIRPFSAGRQRMVEPGEVWATAWRFSVMARIGSVVRRIRISSRARRSRCG